MRFCSLGCVRRRSCVLQARGCVASSVCWVVLALPPPPQKTSAACSPLTHHTMTSHHRRPLTMMGRSRSSTQSSLPLSSLPTCWWWAGSRVRVWLPVLAPLRLVLAPLQRTGRCSNGTSAARQQQQAAVLPCLPQLPHSATNLAPDTPPPPHTHSVSHKHTHTHTHTTLTQTRH
jgi:hypothetical protein